MKTVKIKQNSHLIQLLFSLMVAIGLGSYSYILYKQQSAEIKNSSASLPVYNENLQKLKGVYECDVPGQKSIIHIDGFTNNNEVEFTFFIVNSSGEIFDKTGLAEMKSNNRAVFRELKNNCQIEIIFVDNRVNVEQSNCMDNESFISFAGAYVKK